MGGTGRRAACVVAALAVLSAVPADASRIPAAPYRAPVSSAVAVIDGSPITFAGYRHWLIVALDGNRQATPHTPRIVPLAPPTFTRCIAQVRAKIPTLAKTPTREIRADCRQLFTATNQTVLDFLIKGAWYELEGRRLHITVTDAEVQRTYLHDRRAQFHTPQAFKRFLRSTGQTVADIRYRVRMNLFLGRLEARHVVPITPARIAAYYHAHRSEFRVPGGATQTLAQATPLIRELLTSQQQMHEANAVNRIAARHWRAVTQCRPLYAIDDCAGAATPATGEPAIGPQLAGTSGWMPGAPSNASPAA